MIRQRVVLLVGSESDLEFTTPITNLLDRFGIKTERHLASAHKDSERLIKMIEAYEKLEETIVYVTVSGMSNALSGFVDFKTRHPVIACPRLEDKFGLVDLYSSLRMPLGVASLVILNPESAALAAVKILGENRPELAERIRQFQRDIQMKNRLADERLQEA